MSPESIDVWIVVGLILVAGAVGSLIGYSVWWVRQPYSGWEQHGAAIEWLGVAIGGAGVLMAVILVSGFFLTGNYTMAHAYGEYKTAQTAYDETGDPAAWAYTQEIDGLTWVGSEATTDTRGGESETICWAGYLAGTTGEGQDVASDSAGFTGPCDLERIAAEAYEGTMLTGSDYGAPLLPALWLRILVLTVGWVGGMGSLVAAGWKLTDSYEQQYEAKRKLFVNGHQRLPRWGDQRFESKGPGVSRRAQELWNSTRKLEYGTKDARNDTWMIVASGGMVGAITMWLVWEWGGTGIGLNALEPNGVRAMVLAGMGLMLAGLVVWGISEMVYRRRFQRYATRIQTGVQEMQGRLEAAGETNDWAVILWLVQAGTINTGNWNLEQVMGKQHVRTARSWRELKSEAWCAWGQAEYGSELHTGLTLAESMDQHYTDVCELIDAIDGVMGVR